MVGVASAETCMTDTVTRAMKKKRERRQERRAGPPQLTDLERLQSMTANQNKGLTAYELNVAVRDWQWKNGLTGEERSGILDEFEAVIHANLNLFIRLNKETAKFLFMAMSREEVFELLRYVWKLSCEAVKEYHHKYLHFQGYIGYRTHELFVERMLPKYLTAVAANERAIRYSIKKCVVAAILNVKRDARANASANVIPQYQTPEYQTTQNQSMSEKELLRRERAARSRAAIDEPNEQKNGAEIVWRDPVRLPSPVRVARCEKAKAASIHKVLEHEKFLKELELLRVEEEERRREKRRIGKLIGGS